MSLFEQFQTIIGSIVFGALALFTWTLFNRIFYSKKFIIIRIPFEIGLFCLFAYLYYIFISVYGSGIFNIFYIPSLILGGYIYYHFYAYHFQTLFESAANSIERIIIKPIKLKIKKFHDKLKTRKKKKKHEKTKQINQQSN